MTTKHNPYQALTKIFHEPNRLAIMSALCATKNGLRFTELKEQCELTDGNLNRHLKTLDETKMIRIRKSFVDLKPRTTILVTDSGRTNFLDYLNNLEEVLENAAKAFTHNTAPEGKSDKHIHPVQTELNLFS